MNKKEGSIYEALGVKNTTQDQDKAISVTIRKYLTEPDYCKSDAILEILQILDLPITYETKLAAATMCVFGETLEEITSKFLH